VPCRQWMTLVAHTGMRKAGHWLGQHDMAKGINRGRGAAEGAGSCYCKTPDHDCSEPIAAAVVSDAQQYDCIALCPSRDYDSSPTAIQLGMPVNAQIGYSRY